MDSIITACRLERTTNCHCTAQQNEFFRLAIMQTIYMIFFSSRGLRRGAMAQVDQCNDQYATSTCIYLKPCVTPTWIGLVNDLWPCKTTDIQRFLGNVENCSGRPTYRGCGVCKNVRLWYFLALRKSLLNIKVLVPKIVISKIFD